MRNLATAQRALLAVLMLALAAAMAPAAPSRAIIPFQGAVAVKPGMAPLDAQPYGARFEVFTAATGGERVFEDIQPVTIRNGVFAAELGSGVTPLDPAIARLHPDLWLQITLDLNRSGTYTAEEIIQPRVHLGAAPYALHAATADDANVANWAHQSGSVLVPSILLDDQGQDRLGLSDEGAFVPLLDAGQTIDPLRGGLYRDNGCIAWGVVDSEARLISGFGVAGVRWRSDLEVVEITLFNDVEEINEWPEYSVVASSIDFAQRPEFALFEPIDASRFGITIFDLGSGRVERIRSAFSFIVFGRLR